MGRRRKRREVEDNDNVDTAVKHLSEYRMTIIFAFDIILVVVLSVYK
jgi:hypothetical protein